MLAYTDINNSRRRWEAQEAGKQAKGISLIGTSGAEIWGRGRPAAGMCHVRSLSFIAETIVARGKCLVNTLMAEAEKRQGRKILGRWQPGGICCAGKGDGGRRRDVLRR